MNEVSEADERCNSFGHFFRQWPSYALRDYAERKCTDCGKLEYRHLTADWVHDGLSTGWGE